MLEESTYNNPRYQEYYLFELHMIGCDNMGLAEFEGKKKKK